jgi:hypothetical protein
MAGITLVRVRAPRSHQGIITYPLSTPQENTVPINAGPAARPRALTLVATPLRVPRTVTLEAEFVRRIVQHGMEKMIEPSLAKRMRRTLGIRNGSGTRAVKGVRKKMIGIDRADTLKHLNTPKRCTIGGKKRN